MAFVPVMKSIGMVGPFPPPRHGMSAVNEAMALQAAQNGFHVVRFDTAASSLQRSLPVRLRRLIRFIGAALAAGNFSLRHRGATVYYSLSGGWGLLYESASVAGTRLLGGRVVVHHHSFRYLDAPFWPMSLLAWTAGSEATHVVLGPRMAAKLRERYPAARDVLELSNAIFTGDAPVEPPARSLKSVGYLANLTPAKGLPDVIETVIRSNAAGLPLKFVVAGPFEDPRAEAAFRTRAAAVPNLEYRGPVYGADRENFYAGIDAFIFPTRYLHEAEPLVVLEALARGRPVIAFGRGCIPDLLAGGIGHVVPATADFAAVAVECFTRWTRDPGAFTLQGELARRRFVELKRKSQADIQLLFEKFNGAGYGRTQTQTILGIRFMAAPAPSVAEAGLRGGLVVAPAAPLLVELSGNPALRVALANADLAMADSGLMVLLWRILQGESIPRVSGLAYLRLLLTDSRFNAPHAVLWVMPSAPARDLLLAWLQRTGIQATGEDCWVAPHYGAGTLADPELLALVQRRRPAHVVIGLGGGVQERLGHFLRQSLDYRPGIHCVGGAVGFLTGDQVRIPPWADRFFLGWLWRSLSNPRKFIPRYWRARRLVGLMWRYRDQMPPIETAD
jgi:glycosyltransferase involved in cell wall biosynthesis/UDP-N-acetyl-D-mannosaminuronic acid transferase (WecB/TagA/CpsF family)